MIRLFAALALTALLAAPLPALAQGPDLVGTAVSQAIERERAGAAQQKQVGGAMMFLSYGAAAGAVLALSGPALPVVLVGAGAVVVSGWIKAHHAQERLDRVAQAQKQLAEGDDPVGVIDTLYGIDDPGANIERDLKPLVDALAPPPTANDGFHH